MAQAKNGDSVQVHYTGKLDDGTVFDTSEGRDPLAFRIGEGSVIPGFEQAVEGMNEGETRTARIAPDQAYGPYEQDSVFSVPKSEFPPELDLTAGEQLQVRQPDGQAFLVTVRNVTDSDVTLDANHPLAGKDLTFDIHLVKIGE